ncbi:hypothetical protein [Leifsonia naganoensis]|uniref:Uncharacterized protein n=1 Tax=Leifsonia naganoensis TaxID=150025 RepID=A0A853DU31_9MICO|nr:hypothetical protein [Leifsonia naganoensis]NYK09195.1 hypothetical protein [Leifsonia naganoensis]
MTSRPSWQQRLLVTVIRPLGLGRRTPEKLHASIAKRDAKWTPPSPPAKKLKGIVASSSSAVGWPVWTLAPDEPADGVRRAVVAVLPEAKEVAPRILEQLTGVRA